MELSITFKELIEMVKVLKLSNNSIIISSGRIIPEDIETVYKYSVNTKLNELGNQIFNLIITDEILDMYKSIKSVKENNTLFIFNNDIYYRNNGIDYKLTTQPNPYQMSKVLSNGSFEYHLINPTIHIDNIRSDEKFENALSLKSDQGMVFYWLEQYPLTMFSGLLPINKSDKVSLDIYDNSNETFISKFIIDKGKFKVVNYIKYMKLKRI